ncbi:hypothetical protein AB0407_09200 [Streptomyces microflavus]|uniref:hypothetical protein n=1 Tax=Streptomyces microflavus TaxID=1919 RepID=UPI00344B1E0F
MARQLTTYERLALISKWKSPPGPSEERRLKALRQTGLHLASEGALNAFAERLVEQSEVTQGFGTGALFRTSIESMFNRVRATASNWQLEVLTPENGQFLIDDNPAVTVRTDTTPWSYNMAIGDAPVSVAETSGCAPGLLAPSAPPRHSPSSLRIRSTGPGSLVVDTADRSASLPGVPGRRRPVPPALGALDAGNRGCPVLGFGFTGSYSNVTDPAAGVLEQRPYERCDPDGALTDAPTSWPESGLSRS